MPGSSFVYSTLPAGLHELVGAHRRVADEDDLPVGAVGVDEVERREALVAPARVVAPHVVVDAVVEVEVLEVAELGLGGREQLLADADVRVHRAADVEEQQHLHAVAPLGLQLDVEPAGVARGALDRPRQVEFLGHALAREAAQPTQRDLDVARVELDVAVEVAERALVPDLDRAARAAARPARCGCLPGCSRTRRRGSCRRCRSTSSRPGAARAARPAAASASPSACPSRPAPRPASCPRRTGSAGTPSSATLPGSPRGCRGSS